MTPETPRDRAEDEQAEQAEPKKTSPPPLDPETGEPLEETVGPEPGGGEPSGHLDPFPDSIDPDANAVGSVLDVHDVAHVTVLQRAERRLQVQRVPRA